MQSKVGEVKKFSPKIFILVYTPNKFQWFQKSDKQQKNKNKNKNKKQNKTKQNKTKKLKGPLLITFPASNLKFSSSPSFTIFHFSLSSSFLSPFPFSLPPFQKFPQTFQGWANRLPRPPLVTPLKLATPEKKSKLEELSWYQI